VIETHSPIDTDAIRAALNTWIAGVEQGDPEIVAQVMAPDQDLDYIGVEASDWRIGWPAVRAAYATSRWVIEGDLGGQHISMPLRCSWVLEKREDGWKLVPFTIPPCRRMGR
jgi:ketosteroid isomerase-like protein